MYGDLANKLVNEAKRSQNLESIPLYQDELVRNIVKETKDLERQADILNLEVDESNRADQCQLFVTHLCMRRNKRCLLAYEKLRAEKLAQLAWDNKEPELTNHNEIEYLREYSDLLIGYKSAFPEIDLSGSLEPPKDVFIDVRVIKDAGEIQTEYGVFNLTKDSQFFVRKADVERLIQQGYLQKL
ncbi:DNA replication complex GINS protein [Wickerhamomyces ciferrii]|uniref:DNA replication complex GINS protein PSF1 n=1 Tax=Wickerhamomyces ciferrii (strain ATCC 14091 / BCRC 22168 / CBS 111 / JCM 3599 / NBRC 0793 / NRRL Y-1031 F-60-10) TaxID=1206466 RepID=K0KI79_WICCF|nr:DNA replication complex GINS protein [Wickerhamomyces ciferrii]CCH42711.1 DNA replication complex GINS protein [Wickerhamomyces ciferrii]